MMSMIIYSFLPLYRVLTEQNMRRFHHWIPRDVLPSDDDGNEYRRSNGHMSDKSSFFGSSSILIFLLSY